MRAPSNLNEAVMDDTTWLINLQAVVEYHELLIICCIHLPVQINIIWTFNAQLSAANVVNGLIIYHESAVRVTQGAVRGQDGVVRLHNRCTNLRTPNDFSFSFINNNFFTCGAG